MGFAYRVTNGANVSLGCLRMALGRRFPMHLRQLTFGASRKFGGAIADTTVPHRMR